MYCDVGFVLVVVVDVFEVEFEYLFVMYVVYWFEVFECVGVDLVV